jgi:hypothetical protein
VSPDYLDLLLDRTVRAVPLAEPRLPSGSTSLPGAVELSEVSEEHAVTAPDSPEITLPAPPPLFRRETGKMPELFPPRVIEHAAAADRPQPLPRDPFDRPQRSSEYLEAPPELARDLPTSSTPGDRELRDAPLRAEVPSPSSMPPLPVSRHEDGPARAVPSELLSPPVRKVESAVREVAPTPPSDLAPSPSAPIPVTIRIERIEVRPAPSPPAPTASKPRPKPRLGLDEYLDRRNGGRW